MANVLINDTYLKAIGEAIRSKLGTVLKYKPSEMATAINNIQTLKGGGYKVNITQSEHQTITVSQQSFNNQTAGFTINDYPTINVSLKADPGYIAGSLNHTNFTFSNDVREVDIFATAASHSPNNITYNGNMNVFLYLNTNTKIFNITTGTKKNNIGMGYYANSEAFALTLANTDDGEVESLRVNYNDNFYNLDPNCKYKITAIKIGDTSLSETDISDGDPNIQSTSTYTHINAATDKNWVKSVYKQCTGKELIKVETDIISEDVLNEFAQSENFTGNTKDAFLGEQIAAALFYLGDSVFVKSDLVRFELDPASDSFDEHVELSDDERKKFDSDVDAFNNLYKTNSTVFKTGNLVASYFSKLKELQDKYANDETALNILKQYNPATNTMQHGLKSGFATLDFTNRNPDLFELTYYIDPSDEYGFLAALPGGVAYVLWIFYVRYTAGEYLMKNNNNPGFVPIFEPADPIISTIPVSITFTKVTQ